MKTSVVTSLRPQYGLPALLAALKLPRATYYDRLKRDKKPDKYAKLKAFIRPLFHEKHEIYGYRRIYRETLKAGFKYAEETVWRVMRSMGLSVTLYSKHTSRYSSYKGTVGTVAKNVLKQHFNATLPLTVMHTDVTQVRLTNGQWGYISAITDEASREVLAFSVSSSPNKEMIQDTLNELKRHLLPGSRPILHSDQGWQYQIPSYVAQLKQMNIQQSMSRKGNCHDNAPIESFFNLLKRECLNRLSIGNIANLRDIVAEYSDWFNHERISLNKDGLTPVEYREMMVTEQMEVA